MTHARGHSLRALSARHRTACRTPNTRRCYRALGTLNPSIDRPRGRPDVRPWSFLPTAVICFRHPCADEGFKLLMTLWCSVNEQNWPVRCPCQHLASPLTRSDVAKWGIDIAFEVCRSIYKRLARCTATLPETAAPFIRPLESHVRMNLWRRRYGWSQHCDSFIAGRTFGDSAGGPFRQCARKRRPSKACAARQAQAKTKTLRVGENGVSVLLVTIAPRPMLGEKTPLDPWIAMLSHQP